MLSTDSKGDIVYLSLTDIDGNAILRDQRSDSSLFNKLYTGHHYDQVTDLTYAHARAPVAVHNPVGSVFTTVLLLA